MEANGGLGSAEGSLAGASPQQRETPRRGGRGAPSDDLPDWLPDGWIMEVRRRKDGRNDKYYTSPISGHTFRSAAAVMNYLNFGKDGFLTPPEASYLDEEFLENMTPEEAMGKSKPRRLDWCEDENDDLLNQHGSCFEDNTLAIQSQSNGYEIICTDAPQLHVEALLGWLPKGWIVEIRIRRNERRGRRRYKCYFDPMTRVRFYSKEDVLHYVETGEACNSTHERESDESDMVLSQIEYTPDGFPVGWIKETKIRLNASGIRRDPYYTDPVSEYVFRTKKDVSHFLTTGELSRHAFKPKGASVINKLSKTKESTPPIIAKSLAVQSSEIELKSCPFMPLLPSSMLGGDAPIQDFRYLLSPCEVAGVEILSLTLVNDPKQNNIVDGNTCNPYTKVNHGCSPNVSPKRSPNDVGLFSGDGYPPNPLLENKKLSESPKQKHSRTAEEPLVDVNRASVPDVPSNSSVLMKVELRQENIRTLKSAARELPQRSKAKSMVLNSPSDQHLQKALAHKSEKKLIDNDNHVLVKEKLSSVSNERQLESKHAQFPILENERITVSNQWEFLATTANNLANPVPFRPNLATQHRHYKKLAIRKLPCKTENKSISTSLTSSSMLDNPTNAYHVVPKIPSKPPERLPSLKQLKASSDDADRKQVHGTTVLSISKLQKEKIPVERFTASPTDVLLPSLKQLKASSDDADRKQVHGTTVLSISELQKEKIPVERFTASPTDVLLPGPGDAAKGNWLKPELDKLVPVRFAVVLTADAGTTARYEPSEATLDKYVTFHESADVGSNRPGVGKLFSPTMVVDTSIDSKPADKPHCISKDTPQDVDESSTLKLEAVTLSSGKASKSIPEMPNANLLECRKKVLPVLPNLVHALPAEILKKDCAFVKKQGLELGNKKPFLSEAVCLLEEPETKESNLSNLIKEDLFMLPMEYRSLSLDIPSKISHDPPIFDTTVPAEAVSLTMETPTHPVPTDSITSFPSKVVSQLTSESSLARTEEMLSLPFKRANMPASEACPLDVVDDSVTAASAPALPGATCGLVGTDTNETAEEIPPQITPDGAYPVQMQQEVFLDKPAQDNLVTPSTTNRSLSNSQCEQSPSKGEQLKTMDAKPRRMRTPKVVDETNIIKVPRRSRSPLTRSKCKVVRRTSPRFAGNQPAETIITYKRKRRTT